MQRIDIVTMRQFSPNEQAINAALPILAYECEAALPLENSLDAYEEATLRLISLGLRARGISKALHAPESLVDVLISSLEEKRYVQRAHGSPWTLAEDGTKYLDGTIEERASTETRYGYMFVNSIKREVLPFFYIGDVGNIPLFDIPDDGYELPLRLTNGGDEEASFLPLRIRQPKLQAAYHRYLTYLRRLQEVDQGEVALDTAREEMIDRFADLDALDEDNGDTQAEAELDPTPSQTSGLSANMFIRALQKEPKRLYLHLRILIDPTEPGGYRVESPFDLKGLDDEYFHRQIQWLEQTGSVFLGDSEVHELVVREVNKFGPLYTIPEKDFSFFVLERMPAFRASEHRAPYLYDKMRQLYTAMQVQSTPLERENIVGGLSRSVIEKLLNSFFYEIDKDKISEISNSARIAINRDRSAKNSSFKRQICEYANISENALVFVNIKNIRKRLDSTFGNSIREKIANLLIVNFYLSNRHTRKLFALIDSPNSLESVMRMNDIRNKVSHDTENPFTDDDYDYFMENVFGFINALSTALWGD